MATPRYVLGLHSSHDSSVCLLRDGEIACAIEKERLTRVKHDWGRSDLDLLVKYCLDHEQIKLADVVCIISSEINNIPQTCIFAKGEHQISHHLAHAWAAAGLSGFESCAVMVVDGEGSKVSELAAPERAVCKPSVDFFAEKESYYHFSKNLMLPLLKQTSGRGNESAFSGTDGLGSPYWYLSQLIFGKEHCESKVMGLTAYGSPRSEYDGIIKAHPEGLIEIDRDWIFRLNMQSQDLEGSFQDYANLAASVQAQLEDALVNQAKHLRAITGEERLAYGGGVALNCVANRKLARQTGFKDVYIPFGAGDSSIAIGCAFHGWFSVLGGERCAGRRQSAYTGTTYSQEQTTECLQTFTSSGLVCICEEDPVEAALQSIVGGMLVAVCVGRSEFGPRALGHRSILADARRHDIRDIINRKVKFREPFRPFAVSILDDCLDEWFEWSPSDSLEMQFVSTLRPPKRELVPSVVHADGTVRVQVVPSTSNDYIAKVLKAMRDAGGIPLVLNTSFNVQEPIVETPEDALMTFVGSELDLLILDEIVVRPQRKQLREICEPLESLRLLWHQDLLLSTDLASGTVTLALSSARHTVNYQGWQRTIAADKDLLIGTKIYDFLHRFKPRRGSIYPGTVLAELGDLEVRRSFERCILDSRIATLVKTVSG